VSSLGRALAALGAAGLLLAALGAVLALTSDHLDDRVGQAVVTTTIILGYLGVGLYAWWRRPANRWGALMVAVAFAAFLGSLRFGDGALLFTAGTVLSSLYVAVVIHAVVAYPTGRAESRLERRVLPIGYAVSLLAPLLTTLFDADCGCEGVPHPDNLLLVADAPGVAQALNASLSLLGAITILVAAYATVRRWHRSSRTGRRALSPVLLTGAVMTVLFAALIVVDALVGEGGLLAALNWGVLATFAALPYAFLAGLARSRWWRAGAMVDAVSAAGAGRPLREALADALGDPSLQLAYWLPEQDRYVDAAGRPVAVGPGATVVEREGRRVGALLHDPALGEDPEFARALGAAAALALDNERLEAELRARVDELRASRQRLLEIGLQERRRLERDLHDGAQQRLVALSLQLGLAGAQLDRGVGGIESARQLLEAARGETRAALEDLRELARGIHPAVLTDRGLGAALEVLADRAPLPVEVGAVPGERLPAPVEAAAYFVVSESLTNVAKYAGATRARVDVARREGHALVEVRDDGVGGADPRAGTGLRGLADRLAALDGRLEVLSPPGGGTLVRAELPCASS
jgi:signal transduction histidine kinase